jgi:hypothetical protein
MEITGKIKLLGNTQEVGANGFKKREMVITTAETYPQDLKVEFVKDNCDKLNAFKVGQNVKVAINLRGQEYNGKYYVSLTGWKIESDGAIAQNVSTPVKEEITDDLPF